MAVRSQPLPRCAARSFLSTGLAAPASASVQPPPQQVGKAPSEARPGLAFGALVPVLAVAAKAGGKRKERRAGAFRNGRAVWVARAAAEVDKEQEDEEKALADRLEAKLGTLRDREQALIQRIEAVQTTIDDFASSVQQGPPGEEGEAAAEEPEAAAEEPAAEEAAPEPEPVAEEAAPEPVAEAEAEPEAAEEEAKAEEPAEEVEESPTKALLAEREKAVDDAMKEIATLEGLADMHEDTTRKEIQMLEALSGKKTRLASLKEAGSRLRSMISFEYGALKSRENSLLSKITKTQKEIQDVEEAAEQAEKARKELHLLEGLSDAYEDTTAAEIKALERLAKGEP